MILVYILPMLAMNIAQAFLNAKLVTRNSLDLVFGVIIRNKKDIYIMGGI